MRCKTVFDDSLRYFLSIYRRSVKVFLLFTLLLVVSGCSQDKFANQCDIGKIKLAGSVVHNLEKNSYTVTGSGENIWGNEDAFFFSWNKEVGDVILEADIEWIGKGHHPHRKAGLMIRAGLEMDDPYVDAVIHGDGLISLQYRKSKGGNTFEVQAPVKALARLLLESTGAQFTLFYARSDDILHPVGTISVELPEQKYAGLIVCSHDSTTQETALFTNVRMEDLAVIPADKRVLESTLETVNIESGVRTIIRRAKEHFEAPNWSPDGKLFFYNSGGKIYSLAATGGNPRLLNTSFAANCNNDHGLSPDYQELVISHHQDGISLIYILPVEGGEPRLITEKGPSYWHGWSPDGKFLAYCAERDGEYDVYIIPATGGTEKRLTNAAGLDDGPDYSPDGQYIYFNSIRTGQMKIWRMQSDGSEQIQITANDEYGDWFPHPSPDGKWLVFVSYQKEVVGHPANKDVVLRIMPISGGEPKILATLFGGQGTINVPSWSADSKNVAFVSYRLVSP
jgi:TolB protein